MNKLAANILCLFAGGLMVFVGCQWFRFMPTTPPSQATPTPTPLPTPTPVAQAERPAFIIIPIAYLGEPDPTLCIKAKAVMEYWNATGVGQRTLTMGCSDPRFTFTPNPLTFSGSDHFESEIVYVDNGTPVVTGEPIVFTSTFSKGTAL